MKKVLKWLRVAERVIETILRPNGKKAKTKNNVQAQQN